MKDRDIALFTLDAGRDYGARVAACLGIEPARHEERDFEDGEHKARPLESVRGRDVYVLQGLHGELGAGVNDKLVRLLFFLGALRDADPARLTVVIPYLAYARKERRTKPRDPVTSRYLAALLEAMGVQRVVALDVHNPAAFENAFRVPAIHLEARPLLAGELLRGGAGDGLVVVSPDTGGYKRAERFRETLEARTGAAPGMAFMEKKRSGGTVSGERLVGDVAGCNAVIVDDLISTGGTIARAASAAHAAGATAVTAVASHGLFTGDAARTLAGAPLTRLLVTDSVPAFRLGNAPLRERLTVVDTADFMAEAVRRLHAGDSIVSMMADQG
ncbi:putative ribose-phosphate pyrophosphokinase 2 [wastewater metagenome]|uniref:ribose-phosphate diphosphokinase n=3 Tax=root TaxID=1 RepID=A0A5B8RBV3_9ZZZZ|nr:putative ribose-phosphate pyrophosphokinase 2 [uncultured organism]